MVRGVPPILPGFAFLDALLTRRVGKLFAFGRQWVVFAAAALLIALPLVVYAIANSQAFFAQQDRLLGDDDYRVVLPEHSTFAIRLWGTLLMFFISGDAYVFHNLPGRPVFDLLIAPAFIAGLAVCLYRWRSEPYRFILYWIGLTVLIAAIPQDAAPHYLHASAMLPVLFVVPALGMTAVAGWLTGRLGRPAVWASAAAALVVASGIINTYGYFHDWRSDPSVDNAFDLDMVSIANALNDRGTDPDTAFVLPIGPGYQPGYTHPTLQFLYTGRAPMAFLRMEEPSVPAGLATLLGNRQTLVVVERTQDRMAPADNKSIIQFLALRQGRQIDDERYQGFRLITYKLNAPIQNDFNPDVRLTPNRGFGDILTLTEFSAGQSSRTDAAWAVLSWQLQHTTDVDLKASLRLYDSGGDLVALSDRQLLQSPAFDPTSGWPAGAEESTYHLLDLPNGLPPGDYRFAAVVYDGATGRPYDKSGRPLFTGDSPEISLGAFTLKQPAISDSSPSGAPLLRRNGVALASVQAPDDSIAAGSNFRLTLLWRAEQAAPSDFTFAIQAVDAAGIVKQVWNDLAPATTFQPARWQSGQLVRGVLNLKLNPSIPNGDYQLRMLFPDGVRADVGEIEVAPP
jgi:hypothetical protein